VSTAARIVGRVAIRWEALLVVFILLGGWWSASMSPYFLKQANLLDLTTPYIFLGLMAFGLTFVVIAGEIDISVASTMTVSAAAFAQIWHGGANVWVAAALGLVVAAGLGLVNGLLIAVLGLPSLAVTLGTLAAYRGLAYVILGGNERANFPSSFTEIGGGYIHTDLPVALLVLLGAALVLGLVLHGTRFGRYVFTLGANREATRFSGVPDTRVRVSVFVLSGLMAGVAGVVYVGYFDAIQADAASGSELISVVTAVVLGGVDIFGGAGSMLGVLLALVLVAVLRNGMQLDNVNGAAQDIVVGGLLIGAILAGNVLRALRERGATWRIARPSRREVIQQEVQAAPPAAEPPAAVAAAHNARTSHEGGGVDG
jgi:rhamnose transport system permease protein